MQVTKYIKVAREVFGSEYTGLVCSEEIVEMRRVSQSSRTAHFRSPLAALRRTSLHLSQGKQKQQPEVVSRQNTENGGF